MRNVNWLGLAITVICVACSLGISAYQGFMTAENVVVGLLYGAVGVGAVLWECVGLHRIAHNRREGRPGAALACAIGLFFATLLAISFDTDFLGTLFEGRASVGTAKAGAREALEAERAEAQKQIDKAGIVRPAVAIQGDLDAKAAIRSDAEAAKAAGDDEAARKGCGEICKGHRKRYDELMTALNLPPSPAALAAEMGTARAVETARKRIREIQTELAPLDKAGVADAKSTYIGYLTGWGDQDNRALVAFIIIFFLWCGRVFGPYVFMDPRLSPSPALSAGIFEPITLAEKKPIPAAEYPAINGVAVSADSLSADRPDAACAAENTDDGLSSEELDAYLEMEAAANEAEMLAELEAPAWADRPDQPEPADERLDLQGTRIRRLVEDFAKDCLTYNTDDPTHREAAQIMQDAFKLWLTEKKKDDTVSKMDFGQHMKVILERAGGAFLKAGNRYYVGVMLNPVWANMLGKAPIVETVREPMTDGRRLGRFLDRPGRPPLELEETRGSA